MRQDWVDIVKALAMISVVLGHIAYQYPEHSLFPASVIIAWLWHVPVFFMVGGFFLKDSKMIKPWEFVKDKWRSLYLPILYFYVPVTLLHNWFIDIGFYDTAMEYGGKSVDYWSTWDFLRKTAEAVFLMGREPALGAMWFAYVLFMALCYICIVTFVAKKIMRYDVQKAEKARAAILLVGGVISSLLTEKFDFTIPRFNNVFTAAWLIYVGMLLNQRFKLKFQSRFVFVLSLMLFYSYAVLHGAVHVNHNDFGDIGTLTLSAGSALYIIAFVSKKVKGRVAKVLAWIGKDSFYIMALHFIAFKVCSLILNMFGGNFNPALLEAPAYTLILYFYYAVGGVCMPLLFIYIWRKTRNIIQTNIGPQK